MLTPVLRAAPTCSQLPIAILLTTLNGERFLPAQLDSIANQVHQNWIVYASDDGSTDNTLSILQGYRSAWGEERIRIVDGPRQGFANNFMSLVRSEVIDSSLFAFCDQDDVWYPEKLIRAVAQLETIEENEPALFCSRTRLIDTRGDVLGFSPIFQKAPSFRNALVQSIAGANTMVFNRAVRKLLASVRPDATVISHDWLTYLLVTGCDGRVFFDLEPTLDYRQHDWNLVGANTGISNQLKRAGKMLTGTFRYWNRENMEVLGPIAPRFSSRNQEILRLFDQARNCSLMPRVHMLLRSGVHHQTPLGNAGLLVAAMLKKI